MHKTNLENSSAALDGLTQKISSYERTENASRFNQTFPTSFLSCSFVTFILILLIMETRKKLEQEVHLIGEHRLSVLRLHNKILELKLASLSLINEHYNDFWLDFDLGLCDSRIDCMVRKTKFMTYQASARKMDDLSRQLKEERLSLDMEIAQTEKKLSQYENLDPTLLAEYEKLMEDLECQEMLIKISKDNMSTFNSNMSLWPN